MSEPGTDAGKGERVLLHCCSALDNLVGECKKTSPSDTSLEQYLPLLLGALGFAADTLRGAFSEAFQGRALQSGILARTFYELAIRMRWASLIKPDGWVRLVEYWISQHECTLRPAQKVVSPPNPAIGELLTMYGSRRACDAQPRGFCTVLKEVEAEEPADPQHPEFHKVLYSGYRDLCRYTHANMTLCADGVPKGEIMGVVSITVQYATYELVSAIGTLYTGRGVGKIIDDLLNEISAM